MSGYDCDVAIVGAGLAGAAAASVIAAQGRSVIVLEARDRVGGRAYTRPFSVGGDLVEFGGSWITPWQQRIRHYAALAGIELRPRHETTEHRWHDGQQLRTGNPSGESARPEFDRTMEQIEADSKRHKSGDTTNVGISLNDYLGRIGASPQARSHVIAWWTISGNGDPARISASEFLSSCAYGGGRPEGMIGALAHTLVPGAGVLAERMITLSGAKLRLSAPVAGVRQDSDGVLLSENSGRQTRARAAVICAPLNALNTIDFDPPLSEPKRSAIRQGHGGRAIKVWIKARGVAPGVLATGGNEGLPWMFAERMAADGTTMIVAFGLADPAFNPDDRHAIAGALTRLYPEADLVAWDWHDWVADPFSRGTWLAIPANSPGIADPARWQAEGRIAFATSDFAPEAAGWFEGAICAGEAAALALLRQSNTL